MEFVILEYSTGLFFHGLFLSFTVGSVSNTQQGIYSTSSWLYEQAAAVSQKNHRRTDRQSRGPFPSHALMWGLREGRRGKNMSDLVFVGDASPVRRETKCCNLRAQMLQSQSTQSYTWYILLQGKRVSGRGGCHPLHFPFPQGVWRFWRKSRHRRPKCQGMCCWWWWCDV